MQQVYSTQKTTSKAKNIWPKQNAEIVEKEKRKNSKSFFDQRLLNYRFRWWKN